MKLSSAGALVPVRGFSRAPARSSDGRTAWLSHDGLLAISALERAVLPGSGEPPLVGPQWLVSVSRPKAAPTLPGAPRCLVTDADVGRVVESFDMPAFDEDNHHPGVARHLWCPVEPIYREACECKLTEITVDDAGYRWTTDADGECRGCDYRRRFGPAFPCPLHPV